MVSPTIDRRLGLAGNIAIKAPVTVLAASNITLSGEQTIDGVAVVAENSADVPDRVLCTGQTDATENGIWQVQTGTWTRALDANGNYDLGQGTTVLVNQGSTYAGTYWRLTTAAPITIGTTEMAWSQGLASDLSSLNFLQAGSGAATNGAQTKARERVSALDFLSDAQRANVASGATSLDMLTNINNAITYANTAPRKKLVFPAGTYTVSAAPNFGEDDSWAEGEGKVVLYCSGSGPVAKLDNGAVGHLNCCTFKNFVLKGNAASTYGLYTRGLVRSTVHDIRAVDVATAGFYFDGIVLCHFLNLCVSNNVDTFAVSPTKGMIVTGSSTSNVFDNTIMEAPISSIGVDLDDSDLAVFNGGAFEGVPGGCAVRATSVNNVFNGVDCESNTTYDFDILGIGTSLNNCWLSSAGSSGTALIESGATGTTFMGGYAREVNIDAGSTDNHFGGGFRVSSGGGEGFSGTGGYTTDGSVKFVNPSTYANDGGSKDYGAWTPAIVGGSTMGTQTYTYRVGRYQRVGKLVFFQAYINLATNSGGTGTATLTGLPFTSLNLANMVVEALVTTNQGVTFAGSNDRVVVQINPNSTSAAFVESAGGKSLSAVAIGSIAAGIYAVQGCYISDL